MIFTQHPGFPHRASSKPDQALFVQAETPSPTAQPLKRLAGLLGLIGLGAIVLTACASNGSDASGSKANSDEFGTAASEAAKQPLRDVGFMKRKIPPALARIADPYAPPMGPSCQWINYELAQLDQALGEEVAAPPGADERDLASKSGSAARSNATDAIRGVGAMVVPQRGWIRKLTGAERSDKLFDEARDRGMVRRGYLRGLATSGRCPPVTASR